MSAAPKSKRGAPVPRIPPPPAHAGYRRRRGPPWLLWFLSLAVGAGLGVAAYRFVPGADVTVDYWLALTVER